MVQKEDFHSLTDFFAVAPPATTGIRTRVDDAAEAVSLGLPCVTDLQCRAADPSSRCIDGLCDCTVRTNATGCSARNTGCIPGTFQVWCFKILRFACFEDLGILVLWAYGDFGVLRI